MKLIIAGSRSATLVNIQLPIVEIVCSLAGIKLDEISEVVCGKANGADTLGEDFAKFFDITVKEFPPNYELYPNKKLAPLARNTEMADYGDMLVLIWDGKSTGSLDMQKKMEALKKPVYVYSFDKDATELYNGLLETQPLIDERIKMKGKQPSEPSTTYTCAEDEPSEAKAKPPRKRTKKAEATEQTDLLKPVI